MLTRIGRHQAMLAPPFADALVLTGPTGSGKTALGLELAETLDAEVVSMDSMAVYRGMDIGTAKPTTAERARVRHHLVDVLDPWQSASVAWWLEQARAACMDLGRRGKRPLFVGGTPLYLKALIYGLFKGPPADLRLRAELERDADIHGAESLHRRLAGIDPTTAARLHINDRRRVIRALEVWLTTGTPLSVWQQQWPVESAAEEQPDAKRPSIVWLDVPRPALHTAIDSRVLEMFRRGLVEEVRGLLDKAHPPGREAGQALGYREVIDHLAGRVDLAQTIKLVQAHTRQFAKRQITWFRHLPGCRAASKELTRELWKSTI